MIFFYDWSYPDYDCPSWILREREEERSCIDLGEDNETFCFD